MYTLTLTCDHVLPMPGNSRRNEKPRTRRGFSEYTIGEFCDGLPADTAELVRLGHWNHLLDEFQLARAQAEHFPLHGLP